MGTILFKLRNKNLLAVIFCRLNTNFVVYLSMEIMHVYKLLY